MWNKEILLALRSCKALFAQVYETLLKTSLKSLASLKESEKEMFARLKAEADLPKTESKISKAHGQASKGRGTGSLGAKIQIKNKEPKEPKNMLVCSDMLAGW